jgi:hypothetical protein
MTVLPQKKERGGRENYRNTGAKGVQSHSLQGLTLGEVRSSIPSDRDRERIEVWWGEVFRDQRQIRIMPGRAEPNVLTTSAQINRSGAARMTGRTGRFVEIERVSRNAAGSSAGDS